MEQLPGVGELRQLDREIGNELLHLESVRSLKEVDLIRVELQDCQNRIFKLSESVESLVQDVNAVAVSSQKQVSRGLAQMARCVDMVQQSVQAETAKRQEEINNLSMNVSDMLAQSGAKLREEITALSVEISTVRTERSRDSSVGHSVERSMNSAIGFVEAASVAKLREEMTALSMELLAVRNDVSIEIEAACLAKLREDMMALADVSALRAEHMAENDAASMTKLREDLTVLSTELIAMRTDGFRSKDAASLTKLREDLTALSTELTEMRTDGFRAIEASCLAKMRHDRRDNSIPPGDVERKLVTFREEFSVLSKELSAARSDSSREIRNEMKELLDVVAHEEILRAEHKEQTGNELQELLNVVAREELIRAEGNEALGLELQELRDLVGIEEQQRAALQEAYDSCLHEQDCADLIDFKQTKIWEDLEGLRKYAAFSEETQADLMKDMSSVRAQQVQYGKELSDRIGLVNGTVDAKTSEMQACCSALSSDVAKMSQAFLKLTQKFSALGDETPAQRHALEAETVTDAFLKGKVDSAVLLNSDVWLKRTETSKASVADSDTSEGYSRSSVTVPRSDDDKEHTENLFTSENISFSTSPPNQFRLDCRQVSRPVVASRRSFPALATSRFSPRASSRSSRTTASVAQSPRLSTKLIARENGVPSGETFAAHAPKQTSGDKTDPLQLISRLNALRESMDKADLSDRGASFRRPSPMPS